MCKGEDVLRWPFTQDRDAPPFRVFPIQVGIVRFSLFMAIKVAEHALLEESFEANVRDYTKIINYYGKHNLLEDAENTLVVMKQRGFICDQVVQTTMVDLYSKAAHLDRAKEYFEEIKLLGEHMDKRSYGSMIMAYISAGMPEE
ncbi:hypothetical protein RJT34_01158 [Clitoria ternatea]|uniref:Pentatricopeptide repeat-containing protein n=1 Tax=Clitoria ternatea TaxID=43366 RepID=A0AAN9Q358_CLITE